MRQIERLEKERSKATSQIDLLTRRSKSLGFEFLKPARSGRTVVEAEGLDVRIGDRVLLDGVSFAIERGEHVALVGPNGSGKTTLLETILEQREPQGGSVRLGHGVEARTSRSRRWSSTRAARCCSACSARPGLQRPDAQKLLGRFLFSGWAEHEKPVVALSGGERRRLALALVVASGANFLVVDEPTNHLDLESREALEAALEAFPGTSCSCRTTVRCSTPSPNGRSRSRSGSSTRTTAAGPSTSRAREARTADRRRRAEPKPAKPPRKRARRKKRPSELERIEAEIAERESDRRRARAAARRGLERRRDACRAPAGPRRAAGAAAALGDRVRARADVIEPTPPEVGAPAPAWASATVARAERSLPPSASA